MVCGFFGFLPSSTAGRSSARTLTTWWACSSRCCLHSTTARPGLDATTAVLNNSLPLRNLVASRQNGLHLHNVKPLRPPRLSREPGDPRCGWAHARGKIRYRANGTCRPCPGAHTHDARYGAYHIGQHMVVESFDNCGWDTGRDHGPSVSSMSSRG